MQKKFLTHCILQNRELQERDQSIINMKKSRKQSVIADNNNILRMKVDHKGDTLEAILLPKVLRPWIIASTHKFCGHQGGDHCYYKITATYSWNGNKKWHLPSYIQLQNLQNGITQPGQIYELTSGNRHSTNLHFLAMDTIKIRDADSAYKYIFTLIDMLTNYVFVIPVKNICRKTLVHEYIYKIFLPFRRMEKFLSDNGTIFTNEDWKNLAKALSLKHIQYSPRNSRANDCIENVHNFLKRTMKTIRHSNKSIKSHETIQITAHFPVHQMDTHHFYFTLLENAAIHYGINSIQETTS